MGDDSSDGGDKDRNAATVRDMKGPPVVSSDTMPDVIGVYAPPRPLPEVSQHRTVDLKSVRLSDLADPRRALTERRLVSPPRPPKQSALPWLFGGVAGLAVVAGALWLLLGASPAPVSPAAITAGESSSGAPPAAAPSKASSAPAEPPPGPAPSPPGEPPASTTPALDASSSPPQKAPRSRESAKKRKDPWLE
jgi:hypothetical protein